MGSMNTALALSLPLAPSNCARQKTATSKLSNRVACILSQCSLPSHDVSVRTVRRRMSQVTGVIYYTVFRVSYVRQHSSNKGIRASASASGSGWYCHHADVIVVNFMSISSLGSNLFICYFQDTWRYRQCSWR